MDSKKPKYLEEDGGLVITLLNGETSADLVIGDEVYLSANETVKKRLTADKTKRPIGVVTNGGKAGEYVAVRVDFMQVISVNAKVSAFVVNDFVVPQGSLGTNGLQNYQKGVQNDLSKGIVVSGASQDGIAKIGILKNVEKLP